MMTKELKGDTTLLFFKNIPMKDMPIILNKINVGMFKVRVTLRH